MRKKSEDEKSSFKKNSQKKVDKPIDSDRVVMKKKSGLAKIKNRIQHTVNANKILQLLKKSTLSIPHLLTKQQSKALLPKLQKIVISQPKIHTQIKSKNKFEQIQSQLNQSMVLLKQKAEIQRNDLWAIDLQTQKCYKTIPSFYFKELMTNQEMARNLILTKKNYQMQQSVLVLGDYLDQVQFNINQQANAKIKMFMNFVLCTNSIQDLITINKAKLNATRKHIGLLRDIVVSRAVRINQHRLKKERVQQTLDLLMLFKKLKGIENKLNAQIALGVYISHQAKTKLGALFNQYCELHNVQLKKFCCKTSKNICKYWDITYYVEKGYQDNFIKIIKSYMFQIINCQRQIQKFKQTFTINKKNFMTTPSNPSNSKKGQRQQQPIIMDESFQVDAYDHVELITRINIQKQIVALFEQGMHKYSFSTQNLQQQLKTYISAYINKFLKQTLSFQDNQPRISLRNLTQNPNQQSNYFQSQRCVQKIAKSNWNHFCKMVQMISLRFEYLSIRLLSMIQKLLKKASELQQQTPQRYQVFCAYMSQLISLVMNLTDFYLANLLKNKIKDCQKSITIFKSKDQVMKQFDAQCQNLKKLIKYCNKWITHVEGLQKTYKLCAQQYNKANIKSQKTIQAQSIWCPLVQQLKGTLAKNTYELLHKTIISRDLKQKMQEDKWQFIQIKTAIYNDLGYIIGGKQFLIQQQRNHRDSLSKSILMDRSGTEFQRSTNHNQYNKQQYSSKFKINPTYITLGNLKFKIVASTENMIQFIRKYLQLYDDITQKKKKINLLAKITQLVLMYNQYVKDLILKGQAIKLEKIKTKTITAKHLVIAYMQLQVIDLIYCGELVQKRIGFTNQQLFGIREKLLGTQLQIRKKYQKIIQMRIMDNIQAINLKQQSWLQNQPIQSIPKNIQSSLQLFSDLMLNQAQFEKFVDIDPNWAAQLLSKVSKGIKGKQYKIKCFSFLEEQLKPYYKYLPKLKTAVRSVLN